MQTKDMTTGSPAGLILRFALPLMLGNVFQQFYTLSLIHISVGEIAEKESLPHKFTYQIMKKLEKAGIIRSIRGVNGGCQLDADLDKFSERHIGVGRGEDLRAMLATIGVKSVDELIGPSSLLATK